MKTRQQAALGVIGGSGLYDMPEISGRREVRLKTPFGDPSGPVLLGGLAGVDCAFIPRHGPGHVLLPCEVNSRANIWALKELGAERIVAWSGPAARRWGRRQWDCPPRHLARVNSGRPAAPAGGAARPSRPATESG